ncbi:MAG: DUF2905 domain-containing protein [Burkholderiales bacterium]|nr:DUF2905 domain-containing protein [Burkholderiales bacterium]MCA3156615.1 DUF2905 domain-containing protein [Burkholderiales bacterium]MCA3167583.1 DUF2905 domain-containing protein [Burkholderiales bacterium]
MRWFIAIFLALVLLSALTPWLQKLGIGKLPGDFRFRVLGRDWFIPLTSTLLLSGLVSLLTLLF